jgi:hypothetical protein
MISARGRDRQTILAEVASLKAKLRTEKNGSKRGHLRWNLYELVRELGRMEN